MNWKTNRSCASQVIEEELEKNISHIDVDGGNLSCGCCGVGTGNQLSFPIDKSIFFLSIFGTKVDTLLHFFGCAKLRPKRDEIMKMSPERKAHISIYDR